MTATDIPLPNEFGDENDFWSHEICNNYESNRLGIVRNKFTKNEVGALNNNCGYIYFTCNSNCCKGRKEKKNYRIHRFIWECFNGLIEDGKVIDHINNIKTDNRLENLQVINQHENLKKDYKRRDLTPQKIRAVNVKTGEVFIYKSKNGAAVDLGINPGSIFKVLSGMQNTAKSKKYSERYTFQKIDSEITSPVIIIKNKKNINIKHVRKMIVNNSS